MGTSLCFLSFFPHLVAHLLTCQILVIIINGVLLVSPHLWDGFVALQQFDGWTQMTKRTQTSCKSFFLSAALVLLLASERLPDLEVQGSTVDNSLHPSWVTMKCLKGTGT